jgi:hypothetical protein
VAAAGTEFSIRTARLESGDADFNMTVYDFKSGVIGDATCGCGTHVGTRNEMPFAVVAFESGSVSTLANGERRIYDSSGKPDGGRSLVETLPSRRGIGPEYEDVPKHRKSILEGSWLVITPVEARRALELVSACSDSGRTEKSVAS